MKLIFVQLYETAHQCMCKIMSVTAFSNLPNLKSMHQGFLRYHSVIIQGQYTYNNYTPIIMITLTQ